MSNLDENNRANSNSIHSDRLGILLSSAILLVVLVYAIGFKSQLNKSSFDIKKSNFHAHDIEFFHSIDYALLLPTKISNSRKIGAALHAVDDVDNNNKTTFVVDEEKPAVVSHVKHKSSTVIKISNFL